jgi:EAL domain-containing protein (putative c-di-GMP-specific phosphodiesterase class I)
VAVPHATSDHEATADELLRNADLAMYLAKAQGKGCYQAFAPEMHESVLRRLELNASLERAIEHEEFDLHFQPIVRLDTGEITSLEALVRWHHPKRGLVPPAEFIPLAEETGLIVPIGSWVLRNACRTAAVLQQRNAPTAAPSIAVNLSVRQLQRPEIVDEVRQALADAGLEPGKLVLEITESVMMQDVDLSVERMHALKDLGVRLAVDDFGTGYSSLNSIRSFPIDIVKIDKSFIAGINTDEEVAALTSAIIGLAKILQLRPIAEGIEDVSQLERLRELKCELGQGYAFARPLPLSELEALLPGARAKAA